jgi:NAD(P)-dependent dehydrogenase (short-subunit alcohol dehydrogenase family)
MNKYIAISGAAGGFGAATCKLLSEKGFYIFALDTQTHNFENHDQQQIIPIRTDITNQQSIKSAVLQIRQYTDQLYGLVNIAGFFDQFPLVEADPESFNKLMDINLIGQQHITSAMFSLLHKAKGRVINLSSETVLAQMPLQAYGFSKKLFDIWSAQLRMELELLGMKVITIRPGGHRTPFIDRSINVLNALDENSLYFEVLKQIKIKGLKVLSQVNKDPMDVSNTILKSLTINNPKKIYHVNVSNLFRMLSFIPEGIREFILLRTLNSWMH